MKFPPVLTTTSIRVRANGTALNGEGVNTGGAVPGGSSADHIPITGCALLSLALLDSSSAVTPTDNVRLACAETAK